MRKKWSLKHSKCKRCGTTKTKHQAKGFCVNCYYFLDAHKKNPDMGYKNQWALHFKKCKACGTTKSKHMGHGFCKECYHKFIKKDYIREYMGKYWHQNKEQYEKHKKRVIAYQKTKQGKIKVRKAKKIFLKNHPNYMKNYLRKRREEHEKRGLCIKCSRKVKEGYLLCEVCSFKNKESRKK